MPGLDVRPVATRPLFRLNLELAKSLGLDPYALTTSEGVAILTGSRVDDGFKLLALEYAGHKFWHCVRQVEDGRKTSFTLVFSTEELPTRKGATPVKCVDDYERKRFFLTTFQPIAPANTRRPSKMISHIVEE